MKNQKTNAKWGATVFFAVAMVVLLSGCSQQEELAHYDNTEEVSLFYQRYNEKNREETLRNLAEVENGIHDASLTDEARAELQAKLEKLQLKAQHPEVFTFATIEDLPNDLKWETNWDEEEIGSDEAKKGGVFHYFFEGLAFPDTLRIIGPKSNNSFRGEHYDFVELGLVSLHPETSAIIPSLADQWAVSKDRKTVYFHIDEQATYSDGVAIESDDFFMTFYTRLGPYVSDPWGQKYFEEQFLNITRYDTHTLAITLSTAKPITPYYASLMPSPRHYYRELGPDFERRYDWWPRPTAGAYVINKEDIMKGRSITLTRVKDWWAKDRKYSKNTCNVDKIVYQLVRDPNKALEYFKRGKIDLMPLAKPKSWHEQTEFDAVFNGYIEKATFYNVYPRVPRGLYINCSRALLNNRDIRIGLQHATNFQKIIDFDFRGDAERLNTFSDGYGRFSNEAITAREFSEEKAAAAFAKAGFTKRGEDGVLMNEQGQRLSFTITYGRSQFASTLMTRLKEEAIKAGLEYKLEGMDGSASFSKTQNKKHEICFIGWGTMPPFPRYVGSFHSVNAFEEGTKTPKPMTNNVSVYADPEMDALAQGIRDATSEDEIERKAHRVEEIIHRDAPWIPGYAVPYIRCAYWRWMRWPDNFNVKQIRDLHSSYVFWIDDDIKQETKKAMREGTTFPEKNLIFDQHRN
jgi:microcin C transport system substrate-binding protein